MNDIERVLGALMPAIDRIDGGCSACIGEFIDSANEGLEAEGIEYRYRFRSEYEPDAPFEYVQLVEATA